MHAESNHWQSLGISDEELEEAAAWMSREHPNFQGAMVMFFRTAGSLLRFTRQDFSLLPLVLAQNIIGLEKTLRLVYQDNDRSSLSELLKQATHDRHFAILSEPQEIPLPSWWRRFSQLKSFTDDVRYDDATEWIPRTRNNLVHGEYSLNPKYAGLSLEVRRMADALILHIPQEERDEGEDKQALPCPQGSHPASSIPSSMNTSAR